MRVRGFLIAFSLLLLLCCACDDASRQRNAGGGVPLSDKALLVVDAGDESWAQAHVRFSAPNDVVEISYYWLWISGCGTVELLHNVEGNLQTILSASVCDIDGGASFIAMSGNSAWLCIRVEDGIWHNFVLSLDLEEQRFTVVLDGSTTPCAELLLETKEKIAQDTLYLRVASYPSLDAEFMVDDIVITGAEGMIFEELWDRSESGSPPQSPWGVYAEGEAFATVELVGKK